MENNQIIAESLLEYDISHPVINHLTKNTSFVLHKTQSDDKRSSLEVFNIKKELILETEYEVLGSFYDKYNVFAWSWSQGLTHNSETYLSKQILSYAVNLPYSLAYIKSLLTSSRMVIRDKIQLDIQLALASNIIKQSYILPHESKIGDFKLTTYIILLNRKALDILSDKIKH